MERRTHPRKSIHRPISVGVAPERPLPTANIIDMSLDGALVAFDEPIALHDGERAVLSITVRDGVLHTMSTVVRCARGDDFRTYVAFSFGALRSEDDERLATYLDDPDHPRAGMTDDLSKPTDEASTNPNSKGVPP